MRREWSGSVSDEGGAPSAVERGRRGQVIQLPWTPAPAVERETPHPDPNLRLLAVAVGGLYAVVLLLALAVVLR